MQYPFLEMWVCDLLEKIKEASENNTTYDLHLDSADVKEIAKMYDETDTIEIC